MAGHLGSSMNFTLSFLALFLGLALFTGSSLAIRCYSCPSDATPANCASNMTVTQCPAGMRYCLEVGEVYTKLPQNNRLYLSCSDSCYPYNHIYPSQGSQRYARCCSTDLCNSASTSQIKSLIVAPTAMIALAISLMTMTDVGFL